MADNTQKAINIAKGVNTAVTKVLEGLEELEVLRDKANLSLLNLNDFDADYIEVPEISHLTGNAMLLVLNNAAPDIVTYMASEEYDDYMYQARG